MMSYGNERERLSKPGQIFEHWCDSKDCNAWGTYGYKTKYGQLYYCYAHKDEGEYELARRR